MRLVPAFSCLIVMAALAAAPATAQQAQEVPGPPHPTALHVGERLPSGFSLRSLEGDTYELPESGVGRPLLIVFFRGTW